jgi:hypothetical protein
MNIAILLIFLFDFRAGPGSTQEQGVFEHETFVDSLLLMVLH